MPLRTLTELVRAGALYTAENIVRRGGASAELSRALRVRFGGNFAATLTTVRQLLGRAVQSVSASRSIGIAGDVLPGEIPTAPLGIRRGYYSYRTIVESRIRTGPRRYQQQTRRDQVTITSRSLLNSAEIRERIRGLIGLELGMDTLPGGLGDFLHGGRVVSVTSVIIISVYRGS